MESEEIDLQNSISNIPDQSLPQSPAPVVSPTAQLIPSSSRPLTVRTHVSGNLATTHGMNPSVGDGCWAWLEPAPDCSSRNLLPHVMLRGSVIGIGRGTDAFDLVPEVLQGAAGASGASLYSTTTTTATAAAAVAIVATSPDQAASAPGEKDEVLFDTGSSASPQIPGLFVEIPDGRVSRVHCLISLTPMATTTELSSSSSCSCSPILRDTSRNGTFLNGRKLSRGEEAPLLDGDRISLVLSVAPLTEQAFIFHFGHPLTALLEGPPPTQWIGWKGPSLSEREKEIVAISGGLEEIVSLASPSSKCFPPEAQQQQHASSASSATVPPTTSSSLSSPSPPSSTCVSSYTATAAAAAAMKRSATSLYTTPDAALAEPSTLHCQICLDTMKNAVALEPCGHSYCATCLSQHFGACLQHGQALACPLRCSLPQRVVMNTVVRQLVQELQQLEEDNNNTNTNTLQINSVELISVEAPAAATQMHPVSSLEDSRLPLSLSSLKNEKLISIVQTLSQATENDDNTNAVESFELLAKLAWSDDSSRAVIGAHGGVGVVLEAIEWFWYNEGTLCSGCLALMALIRNGDGPGSSANRWHLGMCGGVEILIKAMNQHRHLAMVQLSALLCLLAVALEGAYFQQKILKLGTQSVLYAITRHLDCEEVVAKGLLVLGALVKEDGVADQLTDAGVIEVIATVLKRYGGMSEDVLWSCMFVLALLSRKNHGSNSGSAEDAGSSDDPRSSSGGCGGGDRSDGSDDNEATEPVTGNFRYIDRLMRMASAGILTPMRKAVGEYRANYDITLTAANNTTRTAGQESEMILAAAEFLEDALERAEQIIWFRRVRRLTHAACVGLLLWMGYSSYKQVKERFIGSGISGGGISVSRGSTRSVSSTGSNVSSAPRRYFPWFV